jgi:hypothetical protein
MYMYQYSCSLSMRIKILCINWVEKLERIVNLPSTILWRYHTSEVLFAAKYKLNNSYFLCSLFIYAFPSVHCHKTIAFSCFKSCLGISFVLYLSYIVEVLHIVGSSRSQKLQRANTLSLIRKTHNRSGNSFLN